MYGRVDLRNNSIGIDGLHACMRLTRNRRICEILVDDHYAEHSTITQLRKTCQANRRALNAGHTDRIKLPPRGQQQGGGGGGGGEAAGVLKTLWSTSCRHSRPLQAMSVFVACSPQSSCVHLNGSKRLLQPLLAARPS